MSFLSSFTWNLGIVALLISAALDTRIAAKLRASRFRAFFCFLLLDAARTALLCLFWQEWGFGWYSVAYWYSRPIYLAALIMVCGELWEYRPWTMAGGICAIEAALIWPWTAELGAVALEADRWLVRGIILAAAVALSRRGGFPRAVAGGIVLWSLAGLVFAHLPGGARMAQVFSYVAAQLVWLFASNRMSDFVECGRSLIQSNADGRHSLAHSR